MCSEQPYASYHKRVAVEEQYSEGQVLPLN